MTDNIWDDPDMRVTDDFFSWKNKPIGTNISGRVMSIGIHTWPDGDKCPQLVLHTPEGDEIGLTVSQMGLKRLMAEYRPMVGDSISVTLVSVEPRPAGKTLNHYELKVKRADGTVTGNATATATARPAPAAAPATPAADPLAGLTAEQRAAVEALNAKPLDDAPPF